MSAFTVRCLHELAQLRELGEQINALNCACESPDAFSTVEFYENFLRRGLLLPQSEVQLWFLAAFDGPTLVGYLALKRRKRKVLGITTTGLEFLVGHETDRPHLVARTEHCVPVARAMYSYLWQHRGQWSWLELQGQTTNSLLHPARLGLQLSGCMIRTFANWENCSIALRWSSVQQYVQAMSKNMRGELRRRLRRLLALGRVEVLTSADPLATPALFDLYCSIEQRSWKSRTEVAIGSPIRAEYLRGLLAARQPMRILIQIVLLDGVPIAGLICGAFTTPVSKVLHALHLAYDSRLAAASPGSAVLLMGVSHAIERGYTCMNLLAGFAYYKTRWLAQTTPLHSIQIYRLGTPLFWRRLCGDVCRQLRSGRSVAQPAADRAQVNEGGAITLVVSSAERRRFAAKITQAHLGHCETLSALEIATKAGIVSQPAPAPMMYRKRVPA